MWSTMVVQSHGAGGSGSAASVASTKTTDMLTTRRRQAGARGGKSAEMRGRSRSATGMRHTCMTMDKDTDNTIADMSTVMGTYIWIWRGGHRSGRLEARRRSWWDRLRRLGCGDRSSGS